MTGSQRQLYSGMLRLFRAFHTGATTWAGVRASGDDMSDPRVQTALPLAPLYAMQNNRVQQAIALPQTLLFTAPWVLLPIGGATIDVQIDDVLSDGTHAFVVQGVDTSQGFQLILAAVANVPASHARRPLRSGLHIGLRAGL